MRMSCFLVTIKKRVAVKKNRKKKKNINVNHNKFTLVTIRYNDMKYISVSHSIVLKPFSNSYTYFTVKHFKFIS